MKKPTVFISSTIYDFRDLRSALKYWLEEAGYDVQMSEYHDFEKDASTNSYDACLNVIQKCDYFILLIGTRVGGMMPGDTISITRKEYQIAYEQFQQGKIIKIITFIRQSVCDVVTDREALISLLKYDSQFDGISTYDKNAIAYHNSKVIAGVEHIMDFINEVTRKKEFKAGEKPQNNWYNTFNSFSNIIEVLRIELALNQNISVRIAEHNVKTALQYNIKQISIGNQDGSHTYFHGFHGIREKLIEFSKASSNIFTTISIPKKLVAKAFEFMVFCKAGIPDLETMIFEDVITKGVFLEYDKSTEVFVESNICRALKQMIREIKRLKRVSSEFSSEDQTRILDKINKKESEIFELDVVDLIRYNAMYEGEYNIYHLSEFLLKYIRTHNNADDYPQILAGLVDKGTSI